MKLDAADMADRREALSELAWYEQVEAAEKELPILVDGPAASPVQWVGPAVIEHLSAVARGDLGARKEAA